MAAGDDADDTMAAIQSILEAAQSEFSAASTPSSSIGAGGAGPARWAGVDADARLRLSRRVREEVNRLREVFVRVRGAIDAVPGGDMTEAELDAAMRAEERELARVQTAQQALAALLRAHGGGGAGGRERKAAEEEDVAMR